MGPAIGILLLSVILVPILVILVLFVLVPIFRGIGWCIRQVFRFIGGMIGDTFRLVGAVITAVVLIPLTVGSIVIGRWSATAHYGRAFQSEVAGAGACIYRLLIGHPARFLCLTALTDGIEQRLPRVVAAAPGADRPRGKAAQFEGYVIVGSLSGGGSGGKLYVAEPDERKLAALRKRGHGDVGQVVIKSFSMGEGSNLPQIIREGRALEAAKKLGLVLEHELSDHRFFYVMRYVPGESLSLVAQRLHAVSGPGGLGDRQLREAMGYVCDLVETLEEYHRGGLWHKDVKPDNIIVDGRRAHLVDFGLLNSLRSSLTLTTHGTEYFRDPEMVRLALKGVKVHEVDGARFDVFGAGAVLYSLIEGSFPAHGGLSQITKRCPEALRWIVRRAMTDYDKRYGSAAELLADLRTVAQAPDPFRLKPVDLPSFRGARGGPAPLPHEGDSAGSVFTPENDDEFLAWLQRNPYGYVLNCDRVPKASYLKLHQANCSSFQSPGVRNFAGGDYLKVCHPQAAELIEWAREKTGGTPDACPLCGPRVPGAGAVASGGGDRARAERTERGRPKIRVANWWTGSYVVEGDAARTRRGSPVPPRAGAPFAAPPPRARQHRGHPLGIPASEQIKRARTRAQGARQRAKERIRTGRVGGPEKFSTNPNPGVIAAVFVFLAGTVVLAAIIAGGSVFFARSGPAAVYTDRAGEATVPILVHARGEGAPVIGSGPGVDRSLEGVSAVVLRDRAALGGPMNQSVDAKLDSLRARGMELIGHSPSNTERETDLLAQLQRSIGLSPWRTESAREAISAWLGEREGLDAVVWIAGDEDGTAAAWWVRSPGLDEGAFAGVVSAFRRVN